jgi:thiamine pyrophosphokinase
LRKEGKNMFGFSWAKEKLSTRGRKWTLTDSERKMNRSEVSSKWNKCRIYVGDQSIILGMKKLRF